MNARPTLLAIALATAFAAHAAPAPGTASDAPAAPAAVAAAPRLAVVNGTVVYAEEFERAFAAVVRQKFYHRAPPEGQIDVVRREVADGLVDRALILGEARRRELRADEDAIRQVLDGYEKRYGESPDWKTTRERALPKIERELREQQLLAKVEAQVREGKVPAEADVRAFYDANPKLFTEPERIRVGVILLKVDPSSPKALRDKAREEARDLHDKLSKGADFAELARLHSADASAQKGGDLGYLHRGMLGEALHTAIDALAPGEVAAPTDVLEGVAIFRLHERREAQRRSFDDVRERAGELLRRERADGDWKRFVADLRKAAVIERNEALYPKTPVASVEGGKDETWAAVRQAPPRGP